MTSQDIKTSCACIVICIAAITAFAAITRNFQTVTSETARHIDLQKSPEPLPDILLVDSHGSALSLSQIGHSNVVNQQVTLITFVYTRCRTICRTTALDQMSLDKLIRKYEASHHIRLLTLSFDQAHDTSAVMKRYASALGADDRSWKFATLARGSDLKTLLDVFGITVLPDGMGGYVHNSAIFLVDRQGRLAGAYPVDAPMRAMAASL